MLRMSDDDDDDDDVRSASDEDDDELAKALKQIRQGCTELYLSGACRGAALRTHRPRHRRTRICTRAGGGACGAPAPSARRTRARRAHTARAPAPRAAGNSIGDEGAKELAAALKANSTLTELNLGSACRGAALRTHRPRHRRTRMHACRRGGRAARQPRAHAARALAAPTPRVRPPRVPQATRSGRMLSPPLRASLLPTRRGRPHRCATPSPPAATPTRDLPRCLEPLPSMHRRHANA